MGHELEPEYGQMLLLPPSLEEWVSADDAVRFVREFVGSLDLEALGFAAPATEEGRPQYSRRVLLGVWLYGYMRRVRSVRALEEACRERMPLIWLTGNRAPDHNTLWRFWKAHQESLRRVFTQVVRVADRAGLIDVVLHAVDGTKVKTASSMRTAQHRESLERRLARAMAEIAELEQAIEQAGAEEGASKLPERLQNQQALRAQIQEALATLKEERRDHRHPAEPEARMMLCEGRKVLSYNAQAVVAQGGLVVAAEVCTAGSDNRQLVPMLDEVQRTLGRTAQTTVADGGFYSTKTLQEAEARSYSVLVREPADKSGEGRPYASSRFRYDAARDVCRCPQDQQLVFVRTRKRREVMVREYRCQVFAECPVRDACSRDPRGRRIEISEARAATERHRQRLARDVDKLAKRGEIVEPIFGIAKQLHGFRRFTVRGQEKVRTQWSLLMSALNLNKLYRSWRDRALPLQAA
jgi:transposase